MRRLLAVLLAFAVLPAAVAFAQDGQGQRPPDASTRGATDLTPRAATLVGVVTPRGEPTTYRFEYGPTAELGSSTPVEAAGSEGGRTVAARITGLQPGTRTYFRVLAAAAAGEARGGLQSFVAPPEVLGLTLVPNPQTATATSTLRLDGRMSGTGVANVPVGLQVYAGRQWRLLGQVVRSGPAGEYAFSVSPVVAPLRLRAVSGTNPPVTSPVTDVRVRPRVGLVAERGPRGRRTFRGTVRPALRGTRVSLQRRKPGGRWVPVARRGTVHGKRTRKYSITVRARPGAYRVVALTKVPGWSRGWSRERAVAGRR